MKRIVLIIGATFLCLALKAQSLSYSCRYWFDQNHAQAVTTTFDESGWDAELDVGSLSEGLHTLFLQICDTSSVWNNPKGYLFYRADTLQSTSGISYHCWFDQDISSLQSNVLGNGHFFVNVSNLENGLHTINIALQNNQNLCSVKSYMFLKVEPIQMDSTDISRLAYHCWFDQDIEHLQTDSLGDGHFLLDVEHLSDGLHTVNVMLEGQAMNAPKSYLFYKKPVGGAIVKWEYWLNDSFNNRHITNLSPSLDTLDIIALLPVESIPVRSTCFHFQPNGDTPYLNAKNEIKLRFWDSEQHFTERSAYYVDEQVEQSIETEVFERNTTVTIPAPNNNQIRWYTLEVGRGDYVSFRSNKVCSMQLFSVSGEEVYSVSGLESMQDGGCSIGEDGVYYLAVHDVLGSEETVSITYNWVYRYSILSYDVHLVGNGGCSTITFNGNGFNSLLDVYLVNWQNDTIRSLDIGHESNTTTTVSFNFYQENLGTYDAVFEFFGETIRINGALEVQEPVDILLTTTVSYPSTFWMNTPCTYTYTITNNGNMSAYAVPIYVYISSLTKDGISHLEIDGLDLPSVIDGVDLDSLSDNDAAYLKSWAEEIGEDHYFFKKRKIDEETGDSICVRSSFFFLTLAPFETKTLVLRITADEPINVYITVPNEVVFPLTYLPNRGNPAYCCIMERVECMIGLVCNAVGLVSTFSGYFAPGTPLAVISSILDCICGIIEQANEELSQAFCEGDDSGFWASVSRALSNLKSMKRITAAVTHCVVSFIPGGFQSAGIIAKVADFFYSATGTQQDCDKAFGENSSCPPGPPAGGGSGPVRSLDPNDIYGYLSESGSHYMRQEIQNVHYEIEFENDTTLATAAAHTIIVRDTLDASKFDLNSLAARSVTIGDKRLDLNGEQTFAKTLDMRPEQYVIAQIDQDYDPTTGIIEWTIQSLDPMTMEPTDDPNQGVLPVNFFGDGVGFIDYSVNLLQAFDDGTEIHNRAGIIFDQEDLIMTPTWTNIVDAVKPTSHIEEVTHEADSLNFSFVSEDSRSGVWYHTLYYRNDSTAMEWQVRKAQIVGNSFMLPLDSLLTTEYLVEAVDSAGNVEDKEMVAEYTYFSTAPAALTQTTALDEGWNWWSTCVEMNGIDGLAMLENSLGENGVRIQSRRDGAVDQFEYNGNHYWYGTLNAIENEQMYKIRTSTACNAELSGFLARRENHPITINEGWTWLGYPIGQSLSLETALSGFTPEPDDVIKGRNAMASFVSYNGQELWYGTLNALEPGQGYMYKSNSSTPKTLTFQNGRSWKAVEATTHEGRVFTRHTANYADNMLITAVVDLEGQELRSEEYELAAFVDNECRGSVRLMYVAPLDRYVAFLLVGGESREALQFVLTDGTDVTLSDDFILYESDGIVGTVNEPITLHFSPLGVEDGSLLPVNIYPNPSKGIFNIEGVGIQKVEVMDTYGQVILSFEVKNDFLQINLSDKASGAYLLRVVTTQGVTTKKVLVTE